MDAEERGYAPPPNEYLRQKLEEGNVVPLIGAGISMGAELADNLRMPSYKELLLDLLEQSKRHMESAEIDKCQSLITEGKLMKAADIIEETLSSGDLYYEIRKLLNHLQPKPSMVHEILNLYDFEVIITSNYDRLLETSLYPTPEVVTYMDTASIKALKQDKKPFIFKIHGDLTRPETVVLGWSRYQKLHKESIKAGSSFRDKVNARGERINIEKALELYIQSTLLEKTLLFLGCSFADSEYSEYFSNFSNAYGNTGKHFALIVKDSVPKDKMREWYKKMGITFIEYVPDKNFSQVWEYLASLKPQRKNYDPQPGTNYENFYLIEERPDYLRQQFEAEKKSISCRYITPSITNCLSTEDYIHQHCDIKFDRYKDRLKSDFPDFKNATLNYMLKRAKGIEDKLADPNFELRAVFLFSKVRKELEDANSIIINRYKYILDLYDRFPNKIHLRAYQGSISEKDYMKSTYALVFAGHEGSDINYFYASQATSNNFTTHMIQMNTRFVTERVEHFEKFWVASASINETKEMLYNEIKKFL